MIQAASRALSRVSRVVGMANVAQMFLPAGTDTSPFGDFWYQPFPRISPSGVPVTQDSALHSSAVWAATNFICGTMAALPRSVFEHVGDARQPAPSHRLHRLIKSEPNPEMDAFVFWEMLFAWQVNRGNGMAEIQRRGDGSVYALWPIHPTRVKGYLRTRATPNVTNGIVWQIRNKAGEEDSFIPDDDVFNLVGALSEDGLIGRGVIDYAFEAIGAAMAGTNFRASFLGNDATPAGLLSHPKTLNPDARENLRKEWKSAYGGPSKKGETAVLWEGMTFTKLGTDPEHAQLIEGFNWDIQELSRFYEVTPHVLSELSRGTFSNVEELQQYIVTFGIGKRVFRAEQAIDRQLFDDDEKSRFYVKFNLDALLRGDAKERQEALQTMLRNGVISVDEWRAFEDMNPLPNGQGKLHFVTADLQSLSVLANKEKQDDAAVTEAVQDTALNGAQIASLLSIVTSVADKLLDPDTAKAMIHASFPSLTDAQVNGMIDPLKTFEPKPAPAPALPAPQADDGAQQEIEEVRQEAKLAAERLAVMETDYRALEVRMADRDRIVARQEAELLAAIEREDALKAGANDFEASITAKDAEIARIDGDFRDSERIAAEIPVLRAALDNEQESHHKSRRRAKRLAVTLSARDGECVGYQREIESSAARVQDTANDMAALKADHADTVDRLQAEITAKIVENGRSLAENGSLWSKMAQSQANAEAFEREREAWRVEREASARAVETAQNQVGTLAAQAGTLQGELDVLKSARDDASTLLVSVTTERDAARLQNTELTRDFADFKRQAEANESNRAVFSAETVEKLTAANKRLAMDALMRLVNFESSEARKYTRRPETFRRHVDTFYEQHHLRLTEALSVATEAQSCLGDKPVRIVEFVEKWIAESRDRLMGIDEKSSADDLAANVRAEVDQWKLRVPEIQPLFERNGR